MERVPLRITGYGPDAAEGFLDIETLSGRRRLAAGLRLLGGWWIAAGVGVFIPVAHFVIVPFCLLGGLVAAGVRVQARTRPAGSEGTCPDCGARQRLDLPRAPRFPMDIACRHCHRALRVSRADG